MLALYQLLQPHEALGTAETPSQEGSYCKQLQQHARWMLLQLFRSKPELCSYVVGLCFFFFCKLSSCFCRAQSQFLTCGCLNSKTATFRKPEVRHQRSAEQKGQAAAVRQTMVRGHLHRSWSLCPQPQPAGFVLPFHKRPDQ